MPAAPNIHRTKALEQIDHVEIACWWRSHKIDAATHRARVVPKKAIQARGARLPALVPNVVGMRPFDEAFWIAIHRNGKHAPYAAAWRDGDRLETAIGYIMRADALGLKIQGTSTSDVVDDHVDICLI